MITERYVTRIVDHRRVDWYLVKLRNAGRKVSIQGYIYVARHIFIPPEWAGKRVRVKIELIDDEENKKTNRI